MIKSDEVSIGIAKWDVKCRNCGHKWTTKAIVPTCGTCHKRADVEWLEEKK